MKRLPSISVNEHAERSIAALRRAVNNESPDNDFIKPYRQPINDLLREVTYQTTRANTLAEKVERLERQLERANQRAYAEAR